MKLEDRQRSKPLQSFPDKSGHSGTVHEPKVARIMAAETAAESDVIPRWMNIALEKAVESFNAGEVPVGCLFIYENEILATGRNTVNLTRNATRHAEINCIDEILEYCASEDLDYRDVFRKIDVVVTVEPCIMCAAALHQLKVRSIVYGCANDRFGGCASVFAVEKIYDSVDIKITGNVKGEQALRLLKDFYKGENPNAPADKVKKKSGKKRKNATGQENS